MKTQLDSTIAPALLKLGPNPEAVTSLLTRPVHLGHRAKQCPSPGKTLRFLVSFALATAAGNSVRGADLLIDGYTYLFPGGTAVYNNIVAGTSAVGTLRQVNGTLTASEGFGLGLNAGATGFFNLSGGTFNSVFLANIGESGTGILTITGGTFDASSNNSQFFVGSQPGSSGTVALSGAGVLKSHGEVVGLRGTGVITQSGGSHIVTQSLAIGHLFGGNGTYNLSGGILDTTQAIFDDTIAGNPGAKGAMNVSGNAIYRANTIVVGDAGDQGTLTLSDSATVEAQTIGVANAGVGNITQTGGTCVITKSMYVGGGTGNGSYDLTGGILDVRDQALSFALGINLGSTGTFSLGGTGQLKVRLLVVGQNGVGVFNQTGGTNTISTGAVVLGAASGSDGTYNMSGGTLDGPVHLGLLAGSTGAFNLSGSAVVTLAQMPVGIEGDGVFTQTGGTLSADAIFVGVKASATGTYNLDGGLLRARQIVGGDGANSGGASTFNFNGGILQATSSSASYFGSLDTINVRNGGAKFDTNGLDVSVVFGLPHSSIAGDAAIDGGFTKLGAGALIFSGVAANTYTGDTQVNGGTLVLAKLGAGAGNDFGSAMAGNLVVNNGGIAKYGADSQVPDGKGITVNIGGLLELNGHADSITDLFLRGGSVTTDTGYLNVRGGVYANNVAPSTYTGNLHLESATAGALHVVSVTGGDLTISGSIANGDNGLAAGLQKTDLLSVFPAGTLILSGTSPNTHAGLTRVDYGTLVLAKSGASAANSFGAAMGGNLRIGSAGNISLYPSAARYEASNQVRDDKDVFVGASAVLNVNGFFDTINNLAIQGGTVNTGAGYLNVRGNISSGNFDLASNYNGNLRLESVIAGGLHEVSVADNGSLTISGVIRNGDNSLSAGINKTGPGTLVFSGPAANVYTGDTQVSAGTLILSRTGAGPTNDFGPAMGSDLVVNSGGTARYGADSQVRDLAGISVNAGGVLDLNGFAESITNLEINAGSVTTGTGYINLRGRLTADGSTTSSFVGNLHLESAAPGALREVSVASGGNLNIAGAVSIGDNGLLSGLNKTGAGTLTMSGSSVNTYLGDTQVNGGVLLLAKTGAGFSNNFGPAMGGNLVINNGGTARYGTDSQVRDGRSVTVNAGGLLDLNGFAESIVDLAINGGNVTTGSGYVNVRGVVSGNGATTSSYAGNLHLESPVVNGLRDVSVAAGGTLTISGVISNGDNGRTTALRKTGPGTLSITGATPNTYAGDTVVSGGTLFLAKSNPGFGNNFGTAIAGSLVVNNGGTVSYGASSQVRDDKSITVNSGGTLELNGFADGVTNLNVNGGTVATGTGSVNVRGAISADSLTSSSIGNLGLVASFANEARPVSVAANGVLTISGNIFNASGFTLPGGLDKTGLGTLNLAGASSYTGGTVVSEGTVLANNATGSATGGGSVTVESGGTLGGSGRIAGAVTVSGGGVLAPGNSPGRLTLGSSLTLPSGAALELELGGTIPGTEYDQLALTGLLTLGGNLRVSLVNGFTPTVNDVFAIVTNSSSAATNGLFANAPGGIYTDDFVSFTVDYAANVDGGAIANDITLTYRGVPEPSIGLLMTLGAMVGGFFRRRTAGRN